MKAVVFHGIGDIRLDDVPEPKIQQPGDAIIRITASAICGTDLHMVRGTLSGMKAGTILGHEGVGVVEEVGAGVRNFRKGDRVVIPSTIACGWCSYCRAGYTAQCDHANPNGPLAGTAFYGGPEWSGSFDGLQAEFARVPFAAHNLIKIPHEVTDEQAILCSDIFPTGYFGAELAEVGAGDTVAVFGCGPVGQFAILSAFMKGAHRVFAVDCLPDRLEVARSQGAECIDFASEDPVEVIRGLTGGIGVDRAIDAVGVDAVAPRGQGHPEEVKVVAPQTNPHGANWHPGDAPSQALSWAVEAVAKAGTLAIIGIYPRTAKVFPVGVAMNKNLSVNAGYCNHRTYIPALIDSIRSGAVEPTGLLSQVQPLSSVIEAYEAFDRRQPGWLKVEILPKAA
ncbi:MAG: alcohol dehydrogenase catalytic domain-containing protein [Magnetospirillum sp.]|nr:alcohol dehydrogenase catalytic domain-containing protein [Magnetospirillum sp.]